MNTHGGTFQLIRVSSVVLITGSALLGLAGCRGAAAAAESTETPSVGVVTPTSGSTVEATSTPTPTPAPTAEVTASAEPTPTVRPTTGAKHGVTPQLTSAYWDDKSQSLVALAYVQGVRESGGICMLTATRSGTTRTATSAGAAVTSYTGCNPLKIAGSKLSSGTWTVRVSYSSATSAGKSDMVDVQVTK